MPAKIEVDPRLDPRIRAAGRGIPTGTPQPSVSSREDLLTQEYSPEALAALQQQTAFFDAMDSEELAPSAGLSVRDETFTSSPDGNTVKIQYIRTDGDETLPCVYYIHGSRMEMNSCYQGNYKTWGRLLAARGLAVAMVDFRNSIHPDSAKEVVPFPGGLNDCISGLKQPPGQPIQRTGQRPQRHREEASLVGGRHRGPNCHHRILRAKRALPWNRTLFRDHHQPRCHHRPHHRRLHPAPEPPLALRQPRESWVDTA